MGPSATAARPSLTSARPSSASTATAKHAAAPRQDATLFQSRFATESAQQPLQSAHSMSAVSDPADTFEPDAFLQPTPASGVGSQHAENTSRSLYSQHSSLQPSSSLPGGMSHLQPSSSRVTSSTTVSRQQAQAASTADQTSPQKLQLQLPFGIALSTESAQTALPSAHQSAPVPQPGTTSSATRLSGSVLSSAQTRRGLSLKDRLDCPRSGVSGKQSVLRWEPAQTSVDSPDKQELGRRKCLHAMLPLLQLVQHSVSLWECVFLLYCLNCDGSVLGCSSIFAPLSHIVYIEVCMLLHDHALVGLFLPQISAQCCFWSSEHQLIRGVQNVQCFTVAVCHLNPLPVLWWGCNCSMSHQLWLIAAFQHTLHKRLHRKTMVVAVSKSHRCLCRHTCLLFPLQFLSLLSRNTRPLRVRVHACMRLSDP